LKAAVLLLTCTGCSWLVSVDDLASVKTNPDGGPDTIITCSGDLTSDSSHCGACGHSCLSGTCRMSLCQPVTLQRSQAEPLGIAVTATQLLWVNRSPPALWQANKDGTGPARIDKPGDGISDPFDIAQDQGYVYWSEAAANIVYRKPLAGGNKEAWVTGPGLTNYIAIDGTSVFVADLRPDSGTIVGRDGVMPALVLYPEQDGIAGLASRDGLLYWPRQAKRQIVRAPISPPGTATHIGDTMGVAAGIAVDEAHAYWVEDRLRVVRVRLDNRADSRTVLYEATAAFGDGDIAVDDVAIYWTERSNGLVRRVAK
jgi:hypothetical protein